ncbi:MAG: heavy metal translocating P-type ATPase [Solirubrobacterales bacterium]
MAPGAPPPPAAPPEPIDRGQADGRRFRVEGMDCAACAQTVQKSVAALDGVQRAEVSFGAAAMTVQGEVADAAVIGAVTRAGYRAYPAGRRPAGPSVPFWRRDPRTISTALSIPLLLFAVIASLAGASRAVAEPLYLLPMATGGWPIARAALSALRVRALDMNVLMTLAAVGAVGIGSYAEGAWVLVLFAVGTTLETFAVDRSRRAVEALMELAPREARVLREEVEHTVPVEQVSPGDLVVVRPGERLPVDGIVAQGSSSVDQSPITGESVPVDVARGDEVYAGALTVQGSLRIQVTRPAAESTLSRIAALVEEAQGTRAPSERFVDRFARIYTPIVFLAALLLATVPLAFGGEPDTWIYRALALLIVACPCSLVISVPVAVVSAIGGAAREGVLIANGQSLEDLGRVSVVALDKTGTVTLGAPELEQVIALADLGKAEALTLMASVEQPSEHPLAAAIVRAARECGAIPGQVDDFEASPGRGVEATVDGRKLWAGGPRLAEERLGTLPAELDDLHAAGQTALVLGEGERPLAVFGVADQLRPEAAAAVEGLSAVGVGRTVMLTGDSERIARRMAERIGITDWRAGLLPEDKLTAVADLQRDGAVVAMVGDGINDAPALAAAQVGVAMGAAGSDVALDSADVALMSDRLDRLTDTLARGRKALSVMRVNVIASLLVKGLFVLLVPFGLVTLVLAVVADMGMSLLVTFNALRLLRRSST